MKKEMFIEKIEAYYGNYKPAVKQFVGDYIATMSDERLDDLFVSVIKTYSSQYKTPPDVAILAQIDGPKDRNYDAEARREFRRIVDNVNIYRDMIIGNVAAQEALNDCGGYIALCNSEIDQLQWIEKRFIQSYKYYRENVPDCGTRQLRGIAEVSTPIVLKSTVKELERPLSIEQKPRVDISKLVEATYVKVE